MSDAVWVDVLPSLKSWGADLAKKAVGSAKDAGRQAGTGYSKAFQDSSKGAEKKVVDDLQKAQREASTLVTKLAGDVSKARQAQARAAADLLTAEQRLADAAKRYGAESNQAQAAALRVEAARGKAEDATKNFVRAEDALREAHKNAEKATADLEKAQKGLGDEVKKAPGMWGKLRDSLKSTDDATDKTRDKLDRLKEMAGSAAKGLAIGVGSVATAAVAAATAVGAIAIKGGFERAMNIEDARAALGGLGHDTEHIDAIMKNALASVKGTAFGLGDAATIAATAVAAGITPGEKLERTLKLTANSAALARVGLDEMGSILNKVWTAGRVSTEELNQLADRGIPIWTKLAESYGVSGSELRDMVSKGKVDAETFADVLEGTVGNAAVAMGDTTRGSWSNMMAALSRGGESFLKGVFPMFKEGLQGITGFIDELAPGIQAFGERVGEWAGKAAEGIKVFIGAFTGNSEVGEFDGILGRINDAGIRTREVVDGIIEGVKVFIGAVSGNSEVGEFDGHLRTINDAGILVRDTVTSIATYVTGTLIPALQNAGKWIVDNKDWLLSLAAAALGVVAAIKAFQIVKTAIDLFKIAKLAVLGFNTALLANPVMLIVAGIAALVAGLTYFFTQTETGKRVWKSFTDAMSSAWNAVVNVVQGVVSWFTENVVPVFQSIWSGIQTAAQVAGTILKVVFVTIATAFSLMWDGVLWAWNTIGKPIFEANKAVAMAMWAFLRDRVFAPLKTGWELLLKGIGWANDTILQPVIAAVRTGFEAAWKFIDRYVFAPLKLAWEAVGAGFRWVKDNVIEPVWSGMKTALKVGWDYIDQYVFGPLKVGVDAIGTAFEKTKDFIGKVWDKVKEAAAKPVNFIIQTVYTDGIKATWDKIAKSVGLSLSLPTVNPITMATGGVLPGYTPGKDIHHFYSPTAGGLSLSGGEAIMRPEFTRAVGGPGGVAALNRASREGTLDELIAHQAFADGGVLGWLSSAASGVGQFVSNVAGGVKDAVVNVGNFLANPAEGIAALITSPMNAVLSGIGAGDLGRSIAEYPRKSVKSLIDKALGLVKGLQGEGAPADASGPLPSIGGWTRPSRGPITSRFGPRWGAFHNGIDIAGGGPTYSIWDGRVKRVGWNVGYGNTGIGILIGHANGLESYYGHNPIGGPKVVPGQLVTSGQRIGAQGATGNVTGVHLHHSIFKNGRALNPMSYGTYDQGGVLNPGFTVAYNGTGKPETIRTAEQEAALHQPMDLSDQTIDALARALAAELGIELGDVVRGTRRAVRSARTVERMGVARD